MPRYVIYIPNVLNVAFTDEIFGCYLKCTIFPLHVCCLFKEFGVFSYLDCLQHWFYGFTIQNYFSSSTYVLYVWIYLKYLESGFKHLLYCCNIGYVHVCQFMLWTFSKNYHQLEWNWVIQIQEFQFVIGMSKINFSLLNNGDTNYVWR